MIKGWDAVSRTYSDVIAHEFGHNLSLLHAPCGGPSGTDPLFPNSDGTIGDWGYDFGADTLVHPTTTDVMSYCGPPAWISRYNFNKALRYRIFREGQPAAAMAAARKSLLVWGGIGRDGELELNPAFLMDAVPSMPAEGGAYQVAAHTDDGRTAFAFSFDMAELADVAEGGAFAFTVPAGAWADRLAVVTLSGPGGTAILDRRTSSPMAILRNPRTGQIRAFVTEFPGAVSGQEEAAATAMAQSQGLEAFFSRGIPGQSSGR